MQKVYFPVGLLNSAGIAGLPVEHKLLISGTAMHKEMLACGVIQLTDYVLVGLGFIPSIGLSVAADLARLDLAVFDESSRLFFARGFFKTNSTPREAGEGSPWAKNVERTFRSLKTAAVANAVRAEIDEQDLSGDPKLESVGGPTNLLTALPRGGCGESWSPSELILLLALYTDNTGHAAGLVVINYDTIGALCSLPPATVAECCDTLDSGKAIKFDRETGEACVFARLANVTKKELKDIQKSLQDLRSTTVKRSTIKYINTKFETRIQKNQNKSTTSTPKEEKGEEGIVNKKKGEEENVNTNDAPASAADVEQENILPAGGPESCTSGALVGSEGVLSTFNDCLDRLRREGARVSEADLEWDRCKLDDLRSFGAVLGYDIVLAVIQTQKYPGSALKACREAGLDDKAKAARKAESTTSDAAAGDANLAKLTADTLSKISDIPRVKGNLNLLKLLEDNKKNAAAGQQ